MANTTNFNWETPDDTDLVKDGAAAIRTLGSAIDTSLVDLKGGTTGQILSKATNTDMDFTWITNDVGDITAVSAGTGISGGGTSGAITITNDMATTITASGDIVVGTGSGTYDNLPIGTTGQVLTADTTVSPYKVKWATPAAGSFVGARAAKPAGDQSIANDTNTTLTWTGTDVFDTDAFHDTSTNTGRLTIPSGKDGYYKIYWTVQWGSANATGRRTCQLYKNGGATAEVSGETTPNASTYPTISGSVTMYLVATDYVELKAYQNSGSSLNISGSGGSPVFGLEKIG